MTNTEEQIYYEEYMRRKAESALTEEEIAEIELWREIQETERGENLTMDDLSN